MGWNNRLFNVNGRGSDMLLKALELAIHQETSRKKASGYFLDDTHGMVLVWATDGGESRNKVHPFPSPLSANAILPIVLDWLESNPDVKCEGWDRDYDHDGHNTKGWRVYCEDWGHVAEDWRAICAIKPVYLWHGK